MIEHLSHYNQTNVTKRLGQNQKLSSPNNLSHRPKDVARDHMRTQLAELNEATPWILRVKRISKMLKDHTKRTMNWQMKHVYKCWPKRVHKKLKVWIRLRIQQEIQVEESMFGGCITNNALPISKDTKGGARGAKALTTHANSSTYPRVKLCLWWPWG